MYKTASGCNAERLKTKLSTIINDDQIGFLKGRLIGENILIEYDMMSYTEFNNIPGFLMLIDFEKAFNTVSWDFIFRTLTFFNFRVLHKKWIKGFYKNISSCFIQMVYFPSILALKEAVDKETQFLHTFVFHVQKI